MEIPKFVSLALSVPLNAIQFRIEERFSAVLNFYFPAFHKRSPHGTHTVKVKRLKNDVSPLPASFRSARKPLKKSTTPRIPE
jgi:hypothetical protein